MDYKVTVITSLLILICGCGSKNDDSANNASLFLEYKQLMAEFGHDCSNWDSLPSPNTPDEIYNLSKAIDDLKVRKADFRLLLSRLNEREISQMDSSIINFRLIISCDAVKNIQMLKFNAYENSASTFTLKHLTSDKNEFVYTDTIYFCDDIASEYFSNNLIEELKNKLLNCDQCLFNGKHYIFERAILVDKKIESNAVRFYESDNLTTKGIIESILKLFKATEIECVN